MCVYANNVEGEHRVILCNSGVYRRESESARLCASPNGALTFTYTPYARSFLFRFIIHRKVV